MRHQAERDTNALEIGFLADGVVTALRDLDQQGTLSELDIEHLNEASRFLQALSEWSGPPTLTGGSSLQLSALSSFGYAAEALRAMRARRFNDGLKSYFASMAEQLAMAASTGRAKPEFVSEAMRFFDALGAATLDRWNASQSPTILTPR
jgi:hypothetical protein